MRKRKNCGFPNSIEVSWRGGKREFFTSFLSREDAYRLVMIAWHQNRWRCRVLATAHAAACSPSSALPTPSSVPRTRYPSHLGWMRLALAACNLAMDYGLRTMMCVECPAGHSCLTATI